jgi:hypothetical protein
MSPWEPLQAELLDALRLETWHPSPLTQAWPLMQWSEAGIALAAYLIGIPVLMGSVSYRGRGFDIKPVVILHNLIMTILSAYMCLETIRQAILADYSLAGM